MPLQTRRVYPGGLRDRSAGINPAARWFVSGRWGTWGEEES
jgi:hypothetical protein